MNKCIVITGQTATGKTSYALKLAKEFNGELINCDSRQLYKYLNIITGKDIPSDCHFEPRLDGSRNLNPNAIIGYYTMQDIKLWLYDVVDPKLSFSSFDYKELATYVIDDIISRGKTPIIVGGSYLYIKQLIYGFESENIPPNWELRKKLEALSVEDLQNKLSKIDKNRLKKMNNSDRNNPRRLIRQIEIASHDRHSQYENNDVIPGFDRESIHVDPLRQLADHGDDIGSRGNKQTPRVGLDYQFDLIGFRFADAGKLVERITERVHERIEQGAIVEVENLLKKGYTKHDPGLNTIGYKEIISYLEGKIDKQKAIDRWILSETQYAKRQYTFMKKDLNINWKPI